MARYIDAEKLKADVMSKSSHLLCEWDTAGVLAEIDRQETADVRPERHGYWIRPTAQTRSYKWKCSECGEISCYVYNGGKYNKNCVCKFLYCPHCGEKMDGKEDQP